LFIKLDKDLTDFLDEVDLKKLTDRATDKGTVKDVLGHIVSWY
jgi:hypothetical protein